LECAPAGQAEFVICDYTIEFAFRDAKQYWGLEDFMNVKERPVTNAVNLAFCMVNIALILRRQMRPKQLDFSVLDLKAHFRGLKYVAETLKWLPQTPDPIVIQQIAAKVALIGAVNAT
jgi:putative transposase